MGLPFSHSADAIVQQLDAFLVIFEKRRNHRKIRQIQKIKLRKEVKQKTRHKIP